MRIPVGGLLAALIGASCVQRGDSLGERLRAGAQAARERAMMAWRWRGDAYYGTLAGKDVEERLCDSTVKSQSGYFKVSGTKNLNYFYYFFESRRDPSKDPLIVWLTGGPGCSSLLALFTENGPCTITRDGFTKPNPFSWNNRANVMWIDQPAGVGFSYGDEADYSHNEEEVAEHLYRFLQAFFEANPHFLANKFYIFAESYGGHFAPAAASRIFEGNKAKDGGPVINLQGIGIGNGITDPETQYGAYPPMAVNNTYGIKVVGDADLRLMQQALPQCQSLIRQCQQAEQICAVARNFCSRAILSHFPTPALNPYDIRVNCAFPPLCYDFTPIDEFLAKPDTMQALHVSPDAADWQPCSTQVNQMFRYDFMRAYHTLLPPMLAAGVKVLVYAGDADYICNWMGNKAWTLALEWEGKDAFNQASDRSWQVEGQAVGEARAHGGLTYLTIYNAGHMVPMDQPAVALAMLDDFLTGGAMTNPVAPIV